MLYPHLAIAIWMQAAYTTMIREKGPAPGNEPFSEDDKIGFIRALSKQDKKDLKIIINKLILLAEHQEISLIN